MTASSLALVRQRPASLAPFARPLVDAAGPRAVLPDPRDERTAQQNYELIKPILEFEANPEPFRMQGIRSKQKLIEHISSQPGGKSAGMIKFLLRRFNQGGRPALARKQRTDSGSSRWFAEHYEAACFVAYWGLICKQNDTAIHRALCALRADLNVAKEELPSRQTIGRWLGTAPENLKVYAHKGRKAYQDICSPFLSRDYSQGFSNEIWVSDHMIHDVEVWNDLFPEQPFGAPIRLRYTAVLDWHSRMVVGSAWCWDGSSASIATALGNAIRTHGCPREFYCDNGKDYLKVTKGAVPAYLLDPEAVRGWVDHEMQRIDELGVLARLGITVRHCLIKHPQSKHIERSFGTTHNFDRLWQGYTGGAPYLRSDAATAMMVQHRKALKRGCLDESLHPRASVFIEYSRQWIGEYNETPHSGQGMENRTPAQVFAEDRNPQWTPAQWADADLAILLSKIVRRKVIRLEVELTAGVKRTYTYFDAVSRDILHDLNSQTVLVSYDENDLSTVAILDEAGHFLTWAREKELMAMSPRDPEIQAETQARIASSMQDRHHLEKVQRDTLEEISRTARAHGAISPIEMMDRRWLTSPSPEAPQRRGPVAGDPAFTSTHASDLEGVLTHKPEKPAAGAATTLMTPAQVARLIGGKTE